MPKGVYKHKKPSEETKNKMSLAKKGKMPKNLKMLWSKKVGKKRSKTYKRLGMKPPYRIGWKHTEETKRKIILGNLGKKRTKKTRRKISKNLLGKTGKLARNWQGGLSLEPYPTDWTDTLKESIRERDNYICQECGIHQDELNYKLHCHHIDYDKNNLDPNNLISLCRNCHCKTNFNREYWTDYFNNKFL